MKRLLSLALVVCASAFGQNAALLPNPRAQFLDAAGVPLAGGFLYTCVTGSACTPAIAGDPALNPLATYTDSTAGVSNTNPIVLDSAGRANVWLGASTYKLVLEDATGGVVWTQDGVTSMQALKTNGVNFLSYTASGTGAVVRTVAAKLGESVSVKDFGAVGDGAADDTAKLQAAISAGAGASVLFPAANYRISSRLIVPANTKLVSIGATITQATQGEIVFYGNSVSNVTISGFTLVGAGFQYVPSLSPTNAAAIYFTTGSNISVEGNTIRGFWSGISGIFLDRFTARNNEVSAWTLFGILTSQTREFQLDNNYLHDNSATVASAWSGVTAYSVGQYVISGGGQYIAIAASTNQAPPNGAYWMAINSYGISATGDHRLASSAWQFANSISYNKIRNVPMWDGIMSHDADGLTIMGNDIRGVRTGLDLTAALANNWLDKITIVGNYLEDTATDYWSGANASNAGIALYGVSSTYPAQNIVISNNVINGFGRFANGSQFLCSVCVINASGVSIGGNQMYNAFIGVQGTGTLKRIAITGNSITTAAGLQQIYFFATTGDLLSITGNTLADATAASTSIKLNGSSTFSQVNISGNSFGSSSPYDVTAATITKIVEDTHNAINASSAASFYALQTARGGNGLSPSSVDIGGSGGGGLVIGNKLVSPASEIVLRPDYIQFIGMPLTSDSSINAALGFKFNGTAGGTQTVNVRNSGNTASCTITYSGGLFISTTCP